MPKKPRRKQKGRRRRSSRGWTPRRREMRRRGMMVIKVLRRQTASLENPLDRVHASVKDPGPDLGDRPKDRDREKDREKEKEKEKESADDDENADVSAETLDEVQSFGKMMILAPALLKKLRRMSPENVAAACRAMARTKFFDGDILRDLNDVLKRLLQRDQLSSAQVNDALQCLWEINAYDQNVLSAIASTFKGKLASLEPIYRQTWREIFEGFKHERDKDFRQLLETPPLTAASPGYQKIRCFHHSKGFCAVGDKACTYSHDPRAPLTLEMFSVPMRASPLVMTQNQYTMGRTIYGGARNGQFAA
ncbi:unnamed protein product [Symbiodinium necroappetens]|uniref:C3H1-type domain-containing protein n=1 Tax=Symbiodinium necroappetens TaxID=1628268 RepID=A0A812VJW1_9DINO|nr:unnamed protein product [Symbiodinium necroappetens]